jgi:hypothetical protein
MAAVASITEWKTTAVIGLAAASFVGALECQSHYAHWTGVPAVRTTNDGADDFASFNRWKRTVEETLKAAALREQRDQAKSGTAGEATKPIDVLQDEPDPPIDLGIDREVARLQKNTWTGKAAINEAPEEDRQTKDQDPFSRSPVIDPVSSGHLEEPQWRHPTRRAWGKGRWHVRHYGWGYYRLIGVARAFPFVLSVR